MNSMFGGAGNAPRGPTGAGGINNSTGFYKEKIPKGYRAGKLQQFTPEQIELFQSLFGHLGPDSFLSQLAGGDQSAFEEMERPALRQFSELQGNLASRFSGAGSLGGARRSSGFQNTMNTAASNFAQELQANRLNLQNQARNDLFSMSQMLMGQRPFENFLIEKPQKQQSSGLGGLFGAGLGGIGGFFAGGPAGALTGAQLGYGIGSSF